MIKTKSLKILPLLIILFILPLISAHQPRIVFDKELSSPLKIENPEVSQAFYGELKENPEYYSIEQENYFGLYVQILVPDTKGIEKDISVEITKNNNPFYKLYGANYSWQPFYEEFAGDNYFGGPELFWDSSSGPNAEPGNYIIKVFSPDNKGKYVLVVGKKESFPPKEMLNTLVSMPKLKSFFDKPTIAIFQGIIGKGILILFIIIISIAIGIYFILTRKRNLKKLK